MRYLLLCCFDEKRWKEIPESKRGGIMREYGELLQGLDKGGHHLASAKLQSSSTATTVRGRSGKPVITDGPFAETKEQLGGYYIIDVPHLDEAVKWAARCPAAQGGSIEVRPIGVTPDTA